MQMVLIRHGEPDRAACQQRNFLGQGYELAPLTPKGVQQARQVACDPLLAGAQVIICSPYTRALQTAAEISRITGLEIRVEMDLRELEKDVRHAARTLKEMDALHQDFLRCKGEHPNGQSYCWESISQLSERIVPIFEKYQCYEKVVVVTHGGVIRRFKEKGKIEYAQPYLIELTGSVRCLGWCE